MVIQRRIYLMVSLYLIAFGGFLAGLAVFQFLPAGVSVAASGLLVVSAAAFIGAAIGLRRAFRS